MTNSISSPDQTPIQILKNLSDENLLSKLKHSVKQERELLVEVLNGLKEVERRRLFASEGYPSLFEFCVKALGYSEGSAQRRIVSMRLMKELPEVADSIANGEHSMSVLAQATQFFNQQQAPQTAAAKREILGALSGMSSRQAEQELAQRNPEPKKPIPDKRPRPITPTLSKLECVVETRLIAEIEELKALLSHARPRMSLSEAIAYSVKLALEKHRVKSPKNSAPSQTPVEVTKSISENSQKGSETMAKLEVNAGKPSSTRSENQRKLKFGISNSEIKEAEFGSMRMAGSPSIAYSADSADHPTADVGGKSDTSTVEDRKRGVSNARYIAPELKRQVWHRDGGTCTFLDAKSGRSCSSRHFVQYDHRVPLALGGSATFDNLRLLCFQHNQLEATRRGLQRPNSR